MNKFIKIGSVALVFVVIIGIYFYKNGVSKQSVDDSKSNSDLSQQQSSKVNNSSSGLGDNAVDVTTNKSLPMLVDLGAGTCIPCKMMAPILEEAKKEYEGKAIIKIIDVNENRDEAIKYNISLIPTQIFFDANGKEVYRHEGVLEKEEIAAKFKEMGVQ